MAQAAGRKVIPTCLDPKNRDASSSDASLVLVTCGRSHVLASSVGLKGSSFLPGREPHILPRPGGLASSSTQHPRLPGVLVQSLNSPFAFICSCVYTAPNSLALAFPRQLFSICIWVNAQFWTSHSVSTTMAVPEGVMQWGPRDGRWRENAPDFALN